MRFLRHPALYFAVVGLIAALGVALRVPGLGRSLWLDEAWVANSVLAADWSGMFHYPDWLQTSPPGFLLLVRGVVGALGTSNEAFRVVPSVASLMAGWLTYALLDRFFPGRRHWVLPFAWATVMLTPQAVELSANLKQYTTEAAVAAGLLWLAARHRAAPAEENFRWLLAAAALAPAFAYSSVFLIPGLALLQWPRWRRAAALAGLPAMVFAAVYVWQIAPNSSAALRAHWAPDHAGQSMFSALLLQARLLNFLFSSDLATTMHPKLMLLPFLALAASLALGRRRRVFVLACFWLPLGLVLAADRFSIYPLSPRTSLFLLPCFALAFSAAAAALVVRFRGGARRLVAPLLLVMTLAYAGRAVRIRPAAAHGSPVERAEEAITYLYSRVQPSDGVYVHASMEQVYRFYAGRLGLRPAVLAVGQTSWPCCPRGRDFPRGRTDRAAVRADLQRLVDPRGPRRWWVLWTDRQEHWDWIAMDDRPVIREYFAEAGCSERVVDRFGNVGLELYVCAAQK